MSLRCPRCGREFDVTLFEYRRRVTCPCGEVLSLDDGHTQHAGSAESPGIEDESPGVDGEAPGSKDEAPGIEDEPPRTKDESPGIEDESPRIEGESATGMEALEREIFRAAERTFDRRRAESFGREADRISAMILYGDMPRIDIEIAIRSFRERVLASFPDSEELFSALYLARFRRFWAQFRDENDPLLPDESS